MFFSIFSGERRGLGESQESQVWMQMGVRFREHLHHLKGAKLAVFLCVALHSDKDGWSGMYVSTIAKETGYSTDTVSRALAELCQLEIEGSRVLLKYQQRTKKGGWGKLRFLIFPNQAEIEKYEDKGDGEQEKAPQGEKADTSPTTTRPGKTPSREKPGTVKTTNKKRKPLKEVNPLTESMENLPEFSGRGGNDLSESGESPQEPQQAALLPTPPPAAQKPTASRKRAPDPVFEALVSAWGLPRAAGGRIGKIKQQLLGRIPPSKPHHECNISPPATVEEVKQFPVWWQRAYPGASLPLAPDKLQQHFADMRQGGAGQQKQSEWGGVDWGDLGFSVP